MMERKFPILWLFLFAMRHKLIHLLPGRKSGIMHENLHINEVFHILLIVDFKLQSHFTPKWFHNHIFAIDHYMKRNKELYAK